MLHLSTPTQKPCGIVPHKLKRPAALFALLCLFLTSASTGFCAKNPVYTWSKQNFFDNKQGGNWSYAWITDNTGPLRCTYTTTTDLQGFHHMIYPATGSAQYNALQHGGIYTVDLRYYIYTPTVSPAYFYVLARNSKGTKYDILNKFNGDATSTLTNLSFPLDLKAIPGGTWTVYFGIVGPGSIVLDSYVISEGSNEVPVAAAANGTPSNNATGITAAAGSAAFTITPPSGTGTLTVSGMVANSAAAATANTDAFLAAIATAVSNGQHTVALPTGNYWMAEMAGANYVSMSITGRSDLTIDGQGSTFVFNHQSTDGAAVFLGTNTRMVIKNLNFDWDWTVLPLASLGKASNVAVSGTTTTCDLTFEDLNDTQTEKVRTTAWGDITQVDPATFVHTGTDPSFKVTLSGTPTRTGNVLHATFTSSVAGLPASGNYYMIRHANYGMAAFKIYSCNNIVFDNVKIYSMPGMGWVWGEDSHHFALKNSGVERAPGSRNPFTTSRDALHVMESQGNILLENCTFTGAGDDLINIHDRCYGHKITVVDSDTITLANYTSLSPLRLHNNDTLEFFNPDYSKLNGSATAVTRQVQSFSVNTSTGVCTINFTTALPTPLSTFAILRNARYNTANVQIKGCSFYNANGHGILISAAGATIENNSFRNVLGTAIELEMNLINNIQSPTDSWWEGDGATDVIIQNNDFDLVSQMGEFGGAVVYARPELPCGASYNQYFDRISILNNSFNRIPGPIAGLNNSKNVIVKNNQITYSETLPSVTSNYLGKILARRSSFLALGGNTWINRITSPYAAEVVYDQDSVASVTPATNAVVSFTGGEAFEDFTGYSIPSTFSSGQSLGSAVDGWLSGWKTASSYSSTTGSVANTPLLDEGNFLRGVVTTQSGKTATSGALIRAFDAASISHSFNISLRFRTNSAAAETMYVISDGQIASTAGGDSSSSFFILSKNGTWQFYDSGATNAYVDSGIPVTANGVYDFLITVDPVLHTWRVSVDNGVNYTVRSGLHGRGTTFATDPGATTGARWLILSVREVVTGTSLGTQGDFAADSVLLEY